MKKFLKRIKDFIVQDDPTEATDTIDVIGSTDEVISKEPEEEKEFPLMGFRTKDEQQSVYGVLAGCGLQTWPGTVLDVGCGHGDFYSYLKNINKSAIYKGIDISDQLINVCKEKGEGEFEVLDLADITEEYDYIIAANLFQTIYPGDMNLYLSKCIDKMYSLAKQGIAFNAPSKLGPALNPFFYYNPTEIFLDCLSKYRRVILRHDYLVDDFTIYIYK